MADTPTTKHGLLKPAYTDPRWDIPSNTNLDTIDNALPPKGGASGQVLSKASANDYDTAWVDTGAGGGGGLPALRPNILMTGNVWGGNIKHDLYGGYEVTPISCIADDGVTQLFLDDTWYGGNQGISGITNYFIVQLDTYEVQIQDTMDSSGNTGLPSNTIAKRWIGFALLDGSAAAVPQMQSGDWVTYQDSSKQRLPDTLVGGDFNPLDHSSLINEDRVELIQYGVYFTASGESLMATSMDGTNVESIIGKPPTSLEPEYENDTWGLSAEQASIIYPYSALREFKPVTLSTFGGILIRGIKYKR